MRESRLGPWFRLQRERGLAERIGQTAEMRRSSLVVVAVLLALTAAACGSSSKKTSATRRATTTTSESTTTSTQPAGGSSTTIAGGTAGAAGRATTTTARGGATGTTGASPTGGKPAPVPAAPGKYRYKQTGKATIGNGSSNVPSEGTLTVDPAKPDGSQVFHRVADPDRSSTD